MAPSSALRSACRVLVVVALAALPGPALGKPAGARTPLAPPDELGPWAVGRTTFSAVDAARGDRTLVVDAWYPVDADDAVGAPSVYDLLLTGVESSVAFDGPPPSRRGPFPLVVFSHGSNGIRFQSWFLCEALASHGFVVLAPDHAGNTALDLLFGSEAPFEQVAVDRPRDVAFVISDALARSADPHDPFAGRIDPRRIGVAGHSFGGFTTLAVAAGFADVPPDPRVGAIVPISPVSTIFSESQLASIRVPMLVLGGTADVTTPVDPQSARAFELAGARPRLRVDVIDAGHGSFTEICAITDALLGVGLPPELLAFLLGNAEEGCAPELVPIAEAHRLTDLYAVSFLRRYVAGDGSVRPFLTRKWARRSEPGVIVERARGR